MNISDLLANPDWDRPFFKRLSHNDTGQAVGHQAGMVLPKDLRSFLPSLDESSTSLQSPTTDRYLLAEMFTGTNRLIDGTVRYQFQTWGGTRSPESRITDGFGPLRKYAAEGDLLVFQRRSDALNRFRLILVKQGTPEFIELEGRVGGRRWGALLTGERPVAQAEITEARNQLIALAQLPFKPFRDEVPRLESTQSRIARSSCFREQVRVEYKLSCSVSRISIATPSSLYEVEAAHVIPMNRGGADDIRNGLALTQSLHWAFDQGLFGVCSDRTVYLPRQVKRMADNSFLKQFEGKPICEAATTAFRVHPDALLWHYDNLVKQWE